MTNHSNDTALNGILAALSAGDRELAEALCRAALKQRPDDAEVWSLLGLSLATEEGLQALKKAAEMEPDEPRWALHLGNGLSARNDFRGAQASYERAAKLSNGHPAAMTAWGNSLMATENFADAANVYRRVLQTHPSPEIWIKAGDALMGARDSINAARAYERAYSDETRPPELSDKLADIHIMLNQYEQAERFNAAVLAATPNNPDAGLRAANLKRWKGEHSAALDLEKRFWSDHPHHTGLVAALLDDKYEPVLENALSIAAELSEDDVGRRRVCFALARYYDRAKNEADAWKYAELANSLYDDGVIYNGGDYRQQLDIAINLYKDMPQIPEGHTHMLYIVGPPRCGGSLLQTILSGVEGYRSVGERGALMSWILPGLKNPEALKASAADLAKADIAGMSNAEGPAAVYIDKTSPHIIVAGILARLHGGARFVYPYRNWADMVVSMYFHDFPPEFAYTRSVQGICDYLSFQNEAVQAWRDAGVEILEHDHDTFTKAPETQAKILFDDLGLTWSPTLLETEGASAVVRTFSSRQVRGGVSKKYTGRGARYAEFLKRAGFKAD